jgi:adenylate kinase
MIYDPSKPVDAILLLGPTGSGKSPLGKQISALGFLGRRSHHLDFGSELRSIGSGIGVKSFSAEEQNFILEVLEHGALLENEHFIIAEKIIRLLLERSRFRTGDVLVLNGIPRHEGQAKDVARVATVHAVVVLVCSVESVIRRIEENTGGDRTGRVDDERVLVERKLRTYAERTAPLIEYYKKNGSRVYHIEVNERTTTGSAYHRLSTLAAADPPVSLVAEPPQR